MRRSAISPAMLLLLASPIASGQPAPAAATAMKPPPTRAEEVKDTFNGVTVADPYRWLEDQKAPDTRSWIDGQNRYSEAWLRSLPGRDALRRRLGALLKVDTVSSPTERGGRYFFFKRLADQDLSILYVRKGANGKDEVLVDPHPLSPDHRDSVNLLDVVEDGSLIAWGLQKGGEDEKVWPRA